jgi:hypothetical protein
LKNGNSINLHVYVYNRNGNKLSFVFKNVTRNEKDGMTGKDELEGKFSHLLQDVAATLYYGQNNIQTKYHSSNHEQLVS